MIIKQQLLVLLMASTILCGTSPAVWMGSNNYKSANIALITNEAIKSGSNTVTFASTFSSTPNLVYGVYQLSTYADDILEYSVLESSTSSSNFVLTWKTGLSTTITLLCVNYLAIDSSITVLGTYSTVPLEQVSSLANVSSGTGLRFTRFSINFTNVTGEVMDLSHSIKMLVYVVGIGIKRNSGNFNWTVSALFLNSNVYAITVFISGDSTMTSFIYSRIIFDQTALQTTKVTYIDAGYKIALNNVWDQLSLSIPWKNSTNFLVGLNSMAYQAGEAVNFAFSEPTLSASGAMSFNNLTICYFNYRYRTCPVSYPLFNEANNMCYDTCGPYTYENTTQGTCLPCLYNCYTCSNITATICLSCNSTVDHRVISGTNCLCDLGYYDTGATVCASCNYSCATCTVGTACTSCTTTRTLASGQCQCNDGYADTGASICVSCSILILGCLNCTSPTACIACDVVHNFVLSSYGNCECSYGNYLNSSASECLPFCSDGITIAPQEECDDGNLIAGDGCSPQCTAQINYTCAVTAKVSSCSWNQKLQINLISLVKDPTSNKLTFTFNINPTNIPNLDSLDFSKLITANLPLQNCTCSFQNGILILIYDYNKTVQGIPGSFFLNPSDNIKFFATPSTLVNFTIEPSNNLPAVVYDKNTYENSKTFENMYQGAVYTSYGLMFLGMFCDKVIGVELLGVLQLAHLSVSDLNGVHPLLSPLMDLSKVNGYNPDLLERDTVGLSNRIREIGYDTVFINNFGGMFLLVLAQILIAIIILTVGKIVPKYNPTCTNIGKRMLKEYLLMLIVFNSFNLSYSLGVTTTYSRQSSSHYTKDMVLGYASLLLPLGIIAGILLTDKKEFGEFLQNYRKDPVSQAYFIVILLYRTALGLMMSKLNEIEQATIYQVFLVIILMVFLMANVCYIKCYHIYRAFIIHYTEIAILSSIMYYRSMKSTTTPEKAYKIFAPAIVSVVMIFASILISAGCTFYELYLKYLRQTKPIIPEQIIDHHLNEGDQTFFYNTTVMNLHDG